MTKAIQLLGLMLSFRPGVEQPYLWLFAALAVYALCLLAAAVRSGKKDAATGVKNVSRVNGFYPILDLKKFSHLVIFFVFCGLLVCLAYTGGSPFIYGRY